MEFIADRITIDDKICNQKHTIRSKRVTVQNVLEFMSAGESKEKKLPQYQSLENDDVNACLQFASELMNRNFTIKTLA